MEDPLPVCRGDQCDPVSLGFDQCSNKIFGWIIFQWTPIKVGVMVVNRIY